MMRPDFMDRLRLWEEKDSLPSAGDLVYFLQSEDDRELALIFSYADTIRRQYVSDLTCVHGFIEFSNHCCCDCAYCGLKKGNQKIERYRMSPEEIIQQAHYAVDSLGYKMIVLQSGEDDYYTKEMLVEIVRTIRSRCRVLLFLSIGERDYRTYKELREAGARGVLFRFETSDQEIFEALKPCQSYESRIGQLKIFQELKYLIATGFMIGYPQQSWLQLARDIIFLQNTGVNMISVGPFIPHRGTPLGDHPGADVDLVLKVIALLRLLYKNKRLPVTTAVETVDKNSGRFKALISGANSLMINLTPEKYRTHYEIYPQRYGLSAGVEESTAEAVQLITYMERKICKGFGSELDIESFSMECEMQYA